MIVASYPGLPSQLFSQPWKKAVAKKSCEGRPGYEATVIHVVCVTENSSEPGSEAPCSCTLHPVTHQNIPASRSEDSSAWRLPVSGGDSSLLVGHYPSHDTTELNESRDKLRMLANRRAMQRLRAPSLILKRVQITQSETLTPYIKMTEEN